jgi:putative transposase
LSERYAFIEGEKENHSVRMLCRMIQVSASGYYDWLGREPSARQVENQELLDEIRIIHAESHERYGERRIQRALERRGKCLGRHRVARLMKQGGLVSKRRRRFRATTDSKHELPVAANVLDREFDVAEPNAVWAGDITYIWTGEGWLYLAVLIDLFSRRVVGWSLSSRIDTELVLRALRMALMQRRPEAGWIHHSDRGSQYASKDYTDELKQAQATVSMSRKGNCWDNAPSESFFASLKTELVHLERFETRDKAIGAILRYLVWYNAHRMHSTLDYASPNEFERRRLTGIQAA